MPWLWQVAIHVHVTKSPILHMLEYLLWLAFEESIFFSQQSLKDRVDCKNYQWLVVVYVIAHFDFLKADFVLLALSQ